MKTNRSPENRTPQGKESRIKPSGGISPAVRGVVDQLRCYVWAYEDPKWDEEERKWKWKRYARSPKTLNRFLWREEFWEKSLDLWGTFEEALAALEGNGRLQGMGFVVEPERPVVVSGEKLGLIFCDFDGCLNPESGEMDPWVMEQIKTQDTYAEVSPSGTGIRTIGFGTRRPGSYTVLPKEVTGGMQVEVYGGGVGKRHLITFTGSPLTGFDKPLRNIQGWIDQTVTLKDSSRNDGGLTPEPLDVSDQEVLGVMYTSADGTLTERFMSGDKTLWRDKRARYESRSEADMGLFRKLAFYTRANKKQMIRIALTSGMRRKKWEREGYLAEIIDKAIAYCQGEFYDPDYSSKENLIQDYFETWTTISDHKLRRAYGALLAHANAYGYYTRKGYVLKAHGSDHVVPEEGIWFYASLRSLGVWMGVDDVPKISRTLRELREDDRELVIRISEGRGAKGTLYLLPASVISSTHSRIQHRREIQLPRYKNSPCISLLCCKAEVDLYLQLVWTRRPATTPTERPGLTDDQRFLVELVLFRGMRHVEEIAAYLDKRQDNLYRRVIGPVVQMGLLETDGEVLTVAEDFEAVLHKVFVASGGEKILKRARDKFEQDRREFRKKGEEANEIEIPGFLRLDRSSGAEDVRRMKIGRPIR